MRKDTDQMLAGVRVLDISNLVAGPGISTNLADFGADVIKVEHPKLGDYIRNWGHKKDGVPLAWKSHARGKRLLGLNLNTPQGQKIIRRLAAGADIMIESYRPGKLEEWGLDYDTLSVQNPKLILVRVTGWGQTGPYKDRPGFGTLAEAISGFAHITGQADGPPTLPSFALGDGITSLVGTYAVMMALYHRDVHDRPGQVIDLSIFESIFSILGPQVIEFDQLGIVQQRFGNRSPRGVPRNAYETSDQRWVAISAFAGDMALRLFRAIDRNDMAADPRYATAAERLARGDVVDGIIADWIKQRPLHDVLERLEQFEVPAAPIYDIEQIQRDPHYQARQTIAQMPDEDLETIKITNIPVKFSRTPGKIRHTGRTAIGYDTIDILQEIGMNKAEIEDLIDRQIVRAPERIERDIS